MDRNAKKLEVTKAEANTHSDRTSGINAKNADVVTENATYVSEDKHLDVDNRANTEIDGGHDPNAGSDKGKDAPENKGMGKGSNAPQETDELSEDLVDDAKQGPSGQVPIDHINESANSKPLSVQEEEDEFEPSDDGSSM